MTLDAVSQAFMEQAADAGGKPLQEGTPEEGRASGDAMTKMFGDGPDMEKVDNLNLTGHDGGPFAVRVLYPSRDPSAVIVYYHGGGWVTGNIDMFDTLGRQLAEGTNATVVMVNYRKAPENPFPTPVEDAWTALNWANENKRWLASAGVPLIVAGDSAGGNLAAVVSLRARDRNGPSIAVQVLVCPVTDHDFSRSSYQSSDTQQNLTSLGMYWFFDHYVPLEQRNNHEVSPLRAQSLAELPPTISLTAGHDPLHDEGIDFAAALDAAGNDIVFRDFDDQMHDFWMMVNVLPGAAVAMEFVVSELTRHLAPTPTQH